MHPFLFSYRGLVLRFSLDFRDSIDLADHLSEISILDMIDQNSSKTTLPPKNYLPSLM